MQHRIGYMLWVLGHGEIDCRSALSVIQEIIMPLQVQPPQPPWMAAFQQQQQQQQQQLTPPPQAQLPSPADAMEAAMPAWWQQLAQQGQQAQPQMQQVIHQPA